LIGRKENVNQVIVMRITCRLLANTAVVYSALLAAPGELLCNEDIAEHSALEGGHGQSQLEETGADRQREGTRLVNQLGRFKTTGDRLTFELTGSDRAYLGLENLALERIGRVLADRQGQAEQLQWEVSGEFTEYRGTNYLLVMHAVLKSRTGGGATTLSQASR
jgi:hypothetical protein